MSASSKKSAKASKKTAEQNATEGAQSISLSPNEAGAASDQKPVVVIGNGWSALAAVGFLAASGQQVKWIAGSGTRILNPLASIEWGSGVQVWSSLAAELGVNCGDVQVGVWIREFRNKAFREPTWVSTAASDDRTEAMNGSLWAPERQVLGASEARWDLLTASELEDEMRRVLLSRRFPNLSYLEGIPVAGFERLDGQIYAVKLGSGDRIECRHVVYADRWGLALGMDGLPKTLGILRKREPMGVLQASFLHDFPEGANAPATSYFAPLFRSPEKEVLRHVWGHFSSDGKKSVWTLCLSPEEVDDNQEIGRKLRRLKGTLDRMFQGSDFVSAKENSFASTILEEQVRFEEEAFYADSNVPEPDFSAGVDGIHFLTDGYGPTKAFQEAHGVVQKLKSLN